MCLRRTKALSSRVSARMGDHPGTPRAVGNTRCTRHMANLRPGVGRVCWSHHQNTPRFTDRKCDWSLELSKKKTKKNKQKKTKNRETLATQLTMEKSFERLETNILNRFLSILLKSLCTSATHSLARKSTNTKNNEDQTWSTLLSLVK